MFPISISDEIHQITKKKNYFFTPIWRGVIMIIPRCMGIIMITPRFFWRSFFCHRYDHDHSQGSGYDHDHTVPREFQYYNIKMTLFDISNTSKWLTMNLWMFSRKCGFSRNIIGYTEICLESFERYLLSITCLGTSFWSADFPEASFRTHKCV